MEDNSLLYLTLNAIISTIIGYFIIGKIIKTIKDKSKLFAAIYFFILFTLMSFMFIFYVKYKNELISSDLYTLINQILYTIFEGMIISSIICIFFSFMILILYLFDGKK
jgi:hypothetical protein